MDEVFHQAGGFVIETVLTRGTGLDLSGTLYQRLVKTGTVVRTGRLS